MNDQEILRGIIIGISSTILSLVIIYFWKFLVELWKSLLRYLKLNLKWLYDKFPYRVYNKNKHKIVSILSKKCTHLLKIHRDWAFSNYSRELQDNTYKYISHSNQSYQSAKETFRDAKRKLWFDFISEKRDWGNIRWAKIYIDKNTS